jgi:hypothetical protein
VPLEHGFDDGPHFVARERVRKRGLLLLIADVTYKVVLESRVCNGHVQGAAKNGDVVVGGLRVAAREEGQRVHEVSGLQSVQGPIAER